MESFPTAVEKFQFCNTLLCLAKSLENRCTTIDLRNETSVTGKITQVDGYMNVVLSDAALYDSDGRYHYLPLMYVQARNIRNIHIPDNVPIKKTIEKQVAPQKKIVKVKKTFKQSRAQKRQEETKKLVMEMKMGKQSSVLKDELQLAEDESQLPEIKSELQSSEIKSEPQSSEVKSEPQSSEPQLSEIKSEPQSPKKNE